MQAAKAPVSLGICADSHNLLLLADVISTVADPEAGRTYQIVGNLTSQLNYVLLKKNILIFMMLYKCF